MTKFWKVVIIISALGVAAVWLVWDLPVPEAVIEEVFCTQDEKLCPDGSYVGKVGPNCEFAPCPGNYR